MKHKLSGRPFGVSHAREKLMSTRLPTVTMAAALACGLLATGAQALGGAPTSGPSVKNIVLVHGAWVDASGWRPVYEILAKDGYNVTMVQEPLTSLADDVAATT